MMSIDVTDEAGTVVKWTVEFDGVLNLTEGAWTERTIAEGERLTVSGNPTHSNSTRMFFRRLVRADGTEVMRHQDTRGTTIDEQRRSAPAKEPSRNNRISGQGDAARGHSRQSQSITRQRA